MSTTAEPKTQSLSEQYRAELRNMRQRAEYEEAQAAYWQRKAMEIRNVAAEALAILSAVHEAINGHRAEGRNDEQGV